MCSLGQPCCLQVFVGIDARKVGTLRKMKRFVLSQGDLEKALCHYESSLKARERRLPPEHPSKFEALRGIGDIYLEQVAFNWIFMTTFQK